MSGGSGNRFWPFSREKKPKQFLDFFETGNSLLQQTFDRFKNIIPIENIFIVTNEKQSKLVKKQLPNLDCRHILLEPIRRNTAPCIAYASSYIKSINSNANIVVTPSDHLISQELNFINNIKAGLSIVCKSPILLTLGIKPTRPEIEYGYIQTYEKNVFFRKVKTFIEKPNYDLAKIFFECDDFFWNSGIFIWNVDAILEAFNMYMPDISINLKKSVSRYSISKGMISFDKKYTQCPNISIDYGIMEKANNVHMLVAEFKWSDLGTWGSLYNLAKKDVQGNATLKCRTFFAESKNNLVTHSDEKLVVVQGLNDYIIIEHNDVLLICKRSEEHRIKQLILNINLTYGKKYL